MEISSVNFIRLYTKPGAAAKNATIYRPSGRNQTCGPAIPVQRSNQLQLQNPLVELQAQVHVYSTYYVMTM